MNDKWGMDHSTGRPILVYENCSVIEGEQAEFALRAIQSLTAAQERVKELESAAEIGRLAISYKKGLVKFVSEQSRPSTTNFELLMQLADENVANRKALDSAIDAALSTQENTK